MDLDFDPEELLRYSRHIVLPDIGLQGQAKLKNSSVLIVGSGGLGSPLALYLAAAGVGRIGIVDYDTVDLSNLQRQILHNTADVGKPKVDSARKKLPALNPHIQVDVYNEMFSSQNAERIAAPYDILVDGTDNIPTRYLMNDLCVLTGKPYVYGAVSQFFGQVSVFDATKGGCYRCLFPEPPPPETLQPCSAAGVMGVMPGVIGLMQATEVIKLIVGIEPTLTGKLLLYDALDYTLQTITVHKNSHCKICGPQPEITHLIDYEQYCHTSIRATPDEASESISQEELSALITAKAPVRIIDLRELVEYQIFAVPTAVNIPFQNLTNEMKSWDKSQPIILICHFGFLSAIARRMLLNAGFEDVKSLKDGMQHWPAANETRI